MINAQDAEFLLNALNNVPVKGLDAAQYTLNVATKLQGIIQSETSQAADVTGEDNPGEDQEETERVA